MSEKDFVFLFVHKKKHRMKCYNLNKYIVYEPLLVFEILLLVTYRDNSFYSKGVS